MAKILGAENSPLKEQIDNAARLSNVTPETFLHAVREVAAINAKAAAVNEDRKAIRKKHKANGIELGQMDAIMKMADWDRSDIIEHFRIRKEYATWMGYTVEGQGDLLANATDDEISKREWRSRGIVAARMGRPAVIPDECPPDYAQDFLEGHDQDTKDRQAQLEAAAGIDPKAKGNVTQIADALKTRAAAPKKAAPKKPAAKQDATKGEAI